MSQPRGPSRINRPRTRGQDTGVFVALLPTGIRNEPVYQELEASATIAAGQTNITLDLAITGPIQAGQYLLFRDADDQEYLCKVTETVDSGTTLTVQPLKEPIPEGAIAEFPPEFTERTAADINRTYNRSTIATFNTGGFEDGPIVGGSVEVPLPGVYYEFCPVFNTILDNADSGREFWVQVELPPPRDGWRGRIVQGAVVFTGITQARPVDGFVSNDFTGSFQGFPAETAAEPLASEPIAS